MTKDLLPKKMEKRKSARGKNRSKNNTPRGNSRRSSARAVERRSLAVYSGTNWLGSIEQRGDTFTAKTIKGRKIGVFGSMKAAADSVGATAEAA